MNDKQIIIYSKHLKRIPSRLEDKPFQWVYFGTGLKERKRVADLLGPLRQRHIGDLLQKTAHNLKKPFLNHIAELGIGQKKLRDWFASNIAYKNPLTSDLFLCWCYEGICETVCLETCQSLIVVIEDLFFYRYLRRKNPGRFVFPKKETIVLPLLKLIVKGLAIRGVLLARLISSIFFTNLVRIKNRNKENPSERIFLFSWIEERFFNGDKLNDVYLGRINEIIEKNGLHFSYLVPLFLSNRLKSQCAKYCRPTFLDQYLTLSDIIQSFCTVIRPVQAPEQRNGLVFREIIHEFASSSSVYALLSYWAFARLFNRLDPGENGTVVYPFENQPWEKMLCLAGKESNARVKLVAYQHTTIPSLLLNYFLGDDEAQLHPLPDWIVANGDHSLEILRNAGYGKVRIVNGGAFRYESLRPAHVHAINDKPEQKTVLISLPYLKHLTIEIIDAVSKSCHDLPNRGIRVLLKFHPGAPSTLFKSSFPDWPGWLQETWESVPVLLNKVDLVIYSSSTVGMEAALAGVSFVKYCSEYIIDLDPLDSLERLNCKICYETDICEQILEELKKADDVSSGEDMRNLVMKHIFSPVDETIWNQIIRDNEIG